MCLILGLYSPVYKKGWRFQSQEKKADKLAKDARDDRAELKKVKDLLEKKSKQMTVRHVYIKFAG